MDPDRAIAWLSEASPPQFLLGILVIALGSKKILSERNLTESFSGLWLPFRALRRRREEQSRREADTLLRLQAEVKRLSRESAAQHDWAVQVTKLVRAWELWAAREGLELPDPRFVGLPEWLSRLDYPEEEDE